MEKVQPSHIMNSTADSHNKMQQIRGDSDDTCMEECSPTYGKTFFPIFY